MCGKKSLRSDLGGIVRQDYQPEVEMEEKLERSGEVGEGDVHRVDHLFIMEDCLVDRGDMVLDEPGCSVWP